MRITPHFANKDEVSSFDVSISVSQTHFQYDVAMENVMSERMEKMEQVIQRASQKADEQERCDKEFIQDLLQSVKQILQAHFKALETVSNMG